MTKLLNLLKILTSKEFYGVVVIKFENGKVVFIEKTEKIKV